MTGSTKGGSDNQEGFVCCYSPAAGPASRSSSAVLRGSWYRVPRRCLYHADVDPAGVSFLLPLLTFLTIIVFKFYLDCLDVFQIVYM